MKLSCAFTLLGKTCTLAAFFISSCTNNRDPNPDVLPSCRITKRVYENNSTIYWLYKYDDQHRISRYEQYEGSDRVSLTTYEYNHQGRIVKKIQEITPPTAANSYPETITCIYEYNSQGLATANACTSNINTNSTKGTSEYDVAGNLAKSNFIQVQGDKIYTNVRVYEYKDGNLIKAIDNPGSLTEMTSEYEYYLDQENKSKEDATQYMYGGSPSRNMLKKGTTTSRDGINTYQVYTYEYNEQGYPIKELVTYSLGYANGYQAYLNEYACQ
jgi:hypothetical protein